MKIIIPVFERVIKIISTNEKIKCDPKTGTWINAVSFKNVGSTDVTINDVINLTVGSAQRVFGSELPAVDTTSYELKFASSGGTDPQVEAIITYCNGFIVKQVPDDLVIPAN